MATDSTNSQISTKGAGNEWTEVQRPPHRSQRKYGLRQRKLGNEQLTESQEDGKKSSDQKEIAPKEFCKDTDCNQLDAESQDFVVVKDHSSKKKLTADEESEVESLDFVVVKDHESNQNDVETDEAPYPFGFRYVIFLIFCFVLGTALSIIICAFDTHITQAMPKVQDPVHQIPADRSGIYSTISGSRSIETVTPTQTVTETMTAFTTICSTETRIIASGIPHSIVPQITIETKTFRHVRHHLSVVLEVTTVRKTPPLQTEVSCSWANMDDRGNYHFTDIRWPEKCEKLKKPSGWKSEG